VPSSIRARVWLFAADNATAFCGMDVVYALLSVSEILSHPAVRNMAANMNINMNFLTITISSIPPHTAT
jgi:hypothetical protein